MREIIKNPILRIVRVVLVCFIAAVALGLIWPLHSVFARIEPFIFGLPLSFAWVIFCLLVMFLALLGLYLLDEAREADTDRKSS